MTQGILQNEDWGDRERWTGMGEATMQVVYESQIYIYIIWNY